MVPLPNIRASKFSTRLACDRFDQLVQTTLRTCRRVLVNQILAGRLVQTFGSDAEFSLSFLVVAGADGVTNATNLRTHPASHGPVVETKFVVLAKAFFCTSGVWHDRSVTVSGPEIVWENGGIGFEICQLAARSSGPLTAGRPDRAA